MSNFFSALRSMVSGHAGSISAARVMMCFFSGFAILTLHTVFGHMVKLADPGILTIWMQGLPSIGYMLLILMAAPYTINKGAGALTSVAASLKERPSEGDTIVNTVIK